MDAKRCLGRYLVAMCQLLFAPPVVESQFAPLSELPDAEVSKGHVLRALGVHGVAFYRQGSGAVTFDGDRTEFLNWRYFMKLDI